MGPEKHFLVLLYLFNVMNRLAPLASLLISGLELNWIALQLASYACFLGRRPGVLRLQQEASSIRQPINK